MAEMIVYITVRKPPNSSFSFSLSKIAWQWTVYENILPRFHCFFLRAWYVLTVAGLVPVGETTTLWNINLQHAYMIKWQHHQPSDSDVWNAFKRPYGGPASASLGNIFSHTLSGLNLKCLNVKIPSNIWGIIVPHLHQLVCLLLMYPA